MGYFILPNCRQIKYILFQLVKKGYDVMGNKQLMTIFSAPNYTGTFNNNAAIVTVNEKMDVAVIILNVSTRFSTNFSPFVAYYILHTVFSTN